MKGLIRNLVLGTAILGGYACIQETEAPKPEIHFHEVKGRIKGERFVSGYSGLMTRYLERYDFSVQTSDGRVYSFRNVRDKRGNSTAGTLDAKFDVGDDVYVLVPTEDSELLDSKLYGVWFEDVK